MRALGIDFGEARIGLALSDEAGRLALAHGAIERDTDRRAVGRIRDLAREEGVRLLVLGEPKGLDGQADERTERVHRFAAKLARATGLELRWVDEALTTVAASQRLAEAGQHDARDRSGRVDALAAQILLQEAIDRDLLNAPSSDA